MKRNVLKINHVLILALFSACAVHAQNEAPVSSFYTPSYRGQAGTESAFWDDTSTSPNGAFTNAYGGPNNATYVAPDGNAPANASVTQTTPGAFLLSNGDIYSFSSTNTFVLNYSVLDSDSFPNGVGNVIFQTETFGSELDYSSVQLSYTLSGGGQETLSATPNQLYYYLGDFGGSPAPDVVTAWQWNLSAEDNVTGFSISFNGADMSVGLERAMLDVASFDSVQPVPEPNTMALAGLGLGLVYLGFRRRQFSR